MIAALLDNGRRRPPCGCSLRGLDRRFQALQRGGQAKRRRGLGQNRHQALRRSTRPEKVLEGVLGKREAVERAPFEWVQAALCFVDSEWVCLAKPFQLEDVWVTWPKELCRMVLRPGPLDREEVEWVAQPLARCFPTR